ncbi:MAG: hypothetical protein KKD99_03065 [Proteobacteria bacterium]|nr:hypothetical protein [Pseudomonadota bacterium]MBU4353823.1 hypothetical protein [Pseudomonadota bacterium]MBU4447543.1 hypothetical protein [Pseudomonadota bacterium]
MSWDNALLIHRAAKNYQGVALMVRDPILMLLAAAWPKVKRQLPDPPPPVKEVDLEALWEKTKVDFQGWAELAQVDICQVMEGWKVLIGNGVILPDGTLNHLADSVLKKEAAGEMLKQFGVKPGEVKK